MRLGKLAACGGVAGPVLFTAAWVVSSLLQSGHQDGRDGRDGQVQLSGWPRWTPGIRRS